MTRAAGKTRIVMKFGGTSLADVERIQAVATYLESILPNLKRAAKTREKAGGNGHAG